MALVVDFDGTITTQDTIGELAKYAIRLQRLRDYVNPEPAWNAIVQAYEDEHREYIEWYVPRESERTSLAQEVEFLRGLADVDARSRQRVEDLRLFAGVGEWILQHADSPFTREWRPVGIRPGFKEFAAAAKQAGLKLIVVSVNWSTGFIKCAIKDPDIEVVANRITDYGKIVGPPGILDHDRVMSTSYDKKLAMDAVTIRHPTAPRPALLYVGDSLTDLECLAACQGVIIAQDGNSTLLRTLSRIGIRVPPIGESGAGDKAQNADMYWAKNFNELLDSGLVDRLIRQWKRGQTQSPALARPNSQ